MAPFMADCLSYLIQLYQYMAVIATRQTEEETLAPLREAGAHGWDDGDGQIGKHRRGALLQHWAESSNATDTKWPMIVRHLTELSVQQMRVQGLAFETATVQGHGVYQQTHSAGNWARRARLARELVAAAMRCARTSREDDDAPGN